MSAMTKRDEEIAAWEARMAEDGTRSLEREDAQAQTRRERAERDKAEGANAEAQ